MGIWPFGSPAAVAFQSVVLWQSEQSPFFWLAGFGAEM
jgi:hypothetical protein